MVTTATPSPNVLDPGLNEKNAVQFQKTKLEKIINENKDTICNVWYRRLTETWQKKLFLDIETLSEILLPGMEAFVLKNHNIFAFDMVLSNIVTRYQHIVKDEPDNSENRIHLANQVKTAISYFPAAVDSILKAVNIPPHWIFSLEFLMKSGVSAALQVFAKSTHMFKVESLESMTTTPDTAQLTSDVHVFHRQNSRYSANEQPMTDQDYLECLPSSSHLQHHFLQTLQENITTMKKIHDVLDKLCDHLTNESNSRSSTADANTIRDMTAYQDLIQFLTEKGICENTINCVSTDFF